MKTNSTRMIKRKLKIHTAKQKVKRLFLGKYILKNDRVWPTISMNRERKIERKRKTQRHVKGTKQRRITRKRSMKTNITIMIK